MLKPGNAAASIAIAALTQATHTGTATATNAPMVKHMELTQENKALVQKACQEPFGNHDPGVLDRYWSDDCIRHNPAMTDGRDSVKTLLEQIGISHWPKQKACFKRIIAEGDLVIPQVMQPKNGDMPETVNLDIIRIESNKIAEHWDVMQPVPANPVNKRPMY